MEQFYQGELWWAVQDLNLRPLACEASALTTELTAPNHIYFTPKSGLCKLVFSQVDSDATGW